MAITQASYQEDLILSRQERAIVRGIYRAYQLSETIETLKKIQLNCTPNAIQDHLVDLVQARIQKIEDLHAYLTSQVLDALLAIKVPTAAQKPGITKSLPNA